MSSEAPTAAHAVKVEGLQTSALRAGACCLEQKGCPHRDGGMASPIAGRQESSALQRARQFRTPPPSPDKGPVMSFTHLWPVPDETDIRALPHEPHGEVG